MYEDGPYIIAQNRFSLYLSSDLLLNSNLAHTLTVLLTQRQVTIKTYYIV